jgi:hypothetical protein
MRAHTPEGETSVSPYSVASGAVGATSKST